MIDKLKRYAAGMLAVSTVFTGSIATVAQAATPGTASSLQELENSLLAHFTQRDADFTLMYAGNPAYVINKINDITKDIETSDPYLAYSMQSWQVKAVGYSGQAYLTFSAKYWDTKDQENYVASKVREIVASLINPQMTEEQKVKAIHDYIVKHVAYDQTYTKYSPYNALAEGTAVCQGYAMLAYKMLSEAGIENLIMTGDADGEPHGWNLVKINGNWYHMDTTWDDPVPDVPGRVSYKYYLLSDAQMKQAKHTWTTNAPAAPSAFQESQIATSAPAAPAAAGTSTAPVGTGKTVMFKLGSNSYQVNGLKQMMDTAPLLKNDRVYIPIRFIASAFGVRDQDIMWDDKSQTVTIQFNGRMIQAVAGAKSMLVNGITIPIPVPVLRNQRETNNRLMLPYRYICNAMGIDVTWNAAAGEVVANLPAQKS
ncbi:stalk domain-containing protein [Aneurinibacillus sp. Ricciae_BoGa-3]|uniref:stalk domain-containing protein n=1 Tax=Aneurinibacillus sp. Ricciae_BoGa-3 TaxID=3022697 RepID=UPI0023401FEE|nr:stalk domain-containing protein [Aneurinibacillus sp. Ricciae_BoGa-3]WCK52758.1 stalk domain-containing protein [Aneurinibacillus sp. Ricciae_BoGa-3]